MDQAHCIVSGFVQGVGFRYFVKTEAEKLGLHGFVKNRVDGKVEVLAQGGKYAIDELIKRCNTGSPGSRVENIEIVWGKTIQPFPTFTILK